MMQFEKILICGCSFSSGYGMPGEKTYENNWPNLLATKLGGKQVKNISRQGANNHWIFLETVSAMLQDHYDLILVQWSAIPRYNFKVGLELYPVDTMLNEDVNIVGKQTVKKEWLAEIKNRLLKIHNDHWDILELVKYVNVLVELQHKARQGSIFFINGLVPWPNDYFVKKNYKVPSELDPFTYNILQAELRDDNEVCKLHDMIHDQYQTYGGIKENHWLNLYQSMLQLKIDDIVPNDQHPGLESQHLFADFFFEQLQRK